MPNPDTLSAYLRNAVKERIVNSNTAPETAAAARIALSVCGDSDPLSWLFEQGTKIPESLEGEETFAATTIAAMLAGSCPPEWRRKIVSLKGVPEALSDALFIQILIQDGYVAGYRAGRQAQKDIDALPPFTGDSPGAG